MGNWGVFSHPLECLLPLLIFLVFGATILPWHLQTPYIGSTPGPHRGCNHQHHDLTMFFSSKSQTKSSFATGILGGVWGTPIQSIHHVHWFFFSKKADENRTPGLMNWFFGDFLHSSRHTWMLLPSVRMKKLCFVACSKPWKKFNPSLGQVKFSNWATKKNLPTFHEILVV